ncbi:hypothetical protein ONR57_17010 [Hoyosella sp. YIM 151337]|uniref:hypothetical protein n=1 Tax=Hoyosella sp. YIM 151337 TaxID=2992742 RepID=UPI0022359DCD|nr:hypothetical protein [Hoyosella sp. YIM 151337]MCW4355006.1 hypothetical protein [Hoyosella sp. YIM 151337]
MIHLTAMILVLLSPAFMPIIVPAVCWINERFFAPPPARARKANVTPQPKPASMITLPSTARAKTEPLKQAA